MNYKYIKREVTNWGIRAVPKLGSELLHKIAGDEGGMYIWQKDWDLLILLDTCRPDWMKEVIPEFDFLTNMQTVRSVGSQSKEWIEKTFDERWEPYLKQTGYVTGNHFADHVPNPKLGYFEDVRKFNIYPSKFPAPPAHIMTDRMVSVGREMEAERFIVHYMQPHKPFLYRNAGRRNVSLKEWSIGNNLYQKLLNSDMSKGDLESEYINNLRYVLQEVDLLLENFNADTVVITSDHGQALGERFLYDHKYGVKHPLMRQVPWVETSASDCETLEPSSYEWSQRDEEQLKQDLQRLGYI